MPHGRSKPRGVRAVVVTTAQAWRRTWAWRSILALWLATSLAVTGLAGWVAAANPGYRDERPGVTAFGVLVVLLFAASLATTLALAGPRKPGDHLLPPAEVAYGRFLASWAASLVLPLATVPAIAVATAFGGVGPGRALAYLAVLAALLGVVAAITVAISTLVGGTVYPVILASIALFGLCAAPVAANAAVYRASETEFEAAKVWWVAAPSPVVVLGDAIPRSDVNDFPEAWVWDPLGNVSHWARGQRDPWVLQGSSVDVMGDGRDRGAPVWRTGLAADAILAGACLVLAVRRRQHGFRLLDCAIAAAAVAAVIAGTALRQRYSVVRTRFDSSYAEGLNGLGLGVDIRDPWADHEYVRRAKILAACCAVLACLVGAAVRRRKLTDCQQVSS